MTTLSQLTKVFDEESAYATLRFHTLHEFVLQNSSKTHFQHSSLSDKEKEQAKKDYKHGDKQSQNKRVYWSC